jgi:TolC family type I secretion outer membrane protein
MPLVRPFAAAGAAAALVLLGPAAAGAVTLQDAIAAAQAHDPGLKRAKAEREAARARLQQARAGRLPQVVASGSAAAASTDFGGFFGFGRYDLHPRGAELSLQQPLFTGGAVAGAIGQARAMDDAARLGLEGARLGLIADVAEAYVGVQVAEQSLTLQQAQVEELALVRSQAQRKFDKGEVPRTEVDQAEARLSGARAALASAQGDLARARARYRTLVGEEPAGLEPVGEPPAGPATLDEAVAQAQDHSPAVAAAQAAVRAADAGVTKAKAERLPSVALAAQASTVRDQFLPGYRADGVSVGVQGRWTLFSSGLVSGKIHEAEAGRRAAEAGLDQARAAAEEAAIDGWQGRRTADAVALAAADQARAAEAALESVRHEVRVGEKPTLALLDAEREALAARISALQAKGARVVAAYRLNAVLGTAP